MKTVEYPAREVEVVASLTCCLCGEEAPRPSEPNGSVWSDTRGEVNSVELRRKTGDNWGTDGGNSVIDEYDVCPACWDSKIVPFFDRYGAKPEHEEYDW